MNSEEINPVAFTIVELCLAEQIGQAYVGKIDRHWLSLITLSKLHVVKESVRFMFGCYIFWAIAIECRPSFSTCHTILSFLLLQSSYKTESVGYSIPNSEKKSIIR